MASLIQVRDLLALRGRMEATQISHTLHAPQPRRNASYPAFIPRYVARYASRCRAILRHAFHKDESVTAVRIYLPTRLASALILYCNQPGLRVVSRH